MENPKNQIVERVKEANNVLVTVSADPSVDQLAAAIGLTLLLNKLGKHATAVYSGRTPSTIEFLQPEETLEKNTDSLRDFIIALDKSKADKLRYKVEDKLVKIFITPYRTSIGQEDLEFSQGDFNVDIVVGLGVKVREDLDEAIAGHGRILHDATVATINTTEAGNLGTLNWVDNQASSLCEMVTAMADLVKTGLFDEQISTALLTGIVAETDRFSNAKTTSNTMNASAKLMAAGANQQLIATKLQEPEKPEESEQPDEPEPEQNDEKPSQENGNSDGALLIDHEELPEPQEDDGEQEQSEQPELKLDENPDENIDKTIRKNDSRLFLDEPPTSEDQLTANTKPDDENEAAVDPLSQTNPDGMLLSHDSGPAMAEEDNEGDWVQKGAPGQTEPPANPTLTQLEESVDSPHTDEVSPPEEMPQHEVPAEETGTPDVGQARDAVQAAAAGNEEPLEPIAALNAQPVDLDLGHEDATNALPPEPPPADVPPPEPTSDVQIDPETGAIKYPEPLAMPPVPSAPASDTGLPSNLVPPVSGLPADPTAPNVDNPTAPPPVPPPMMPPTMPLPNSPQPGGNPLLPPQQ